MSESPVRVDHNAIRRFTREVFEKVGMPPEDANTEADVLLWANLRGVDSHGVLRIPLMHCLIHYEGCGDRSV